MSTGERGTRPDFSETVADVAREAGVAPSAVRFYEQHGLVRAVRTPGGARRFDATAACRIKVAKVAQRVGLTIREIVEVLERLPADPAPADWGLVCERLVREAEERVAALQAQLDALGGDTRLCDLAAVGSDQRS
ncbi:MerR family transcriptional regulator [Nocardioides zeae]|uniref:MerR family transcriptional regulator n=1 Tax=Nocardioides zeae TaxID=1457234 RepID=UPI00286C8E14|nr:MerR family DNA-binding transcriptional regulator [Nocardioides zeae]